MRTLTWPSFIQTPGTAPPIGGASGSSYAQSGITDSTASLTFNGSQIIWTLVEGPNYGIAEVSMDGTVIDNVDGYAAALTFGQTCTYAVSSGVHTLTIRVTGRKNANSNSTNVGVDLFTVQ